MNKGRRQQRGLDRKGLYVGVRGTEQLTTLNIHLGNHLEPFAMQVSGPQQDE